MAGPRGLRVRSASVENESLVGVNKKPLQRQVGRSSLAVKDTNRSLDSAPRGALPPKAPIGPGMSRNFARGPPPKTIPEFEVYIDEENTTKPAKTEESVLFNDSKKAVKRIPLAPVVNVEAHLSLDARIQAKPAQSSTLESVTPNSIQKAQAHDSGHYSGSNRSEASSLSRTSLWTTLSSNFLSAPSKLPAVSDPAVSHCCYFEDHWKYMLAEEQKTLPKESFMRKQPELRDEMRVILLDWLVEVVAVYQMASETLHLTARIIDRMLSVNIIPKGKFQLVGTTALLIASKYEEIYPPELKEFSKITEDTFSTAQILSMERIILNVIKFQVGVPTSLWFVLHLCTAVKVSSKTRNYATFVLEVTLLHSNLVILRPSRLAAAALCIANAATDQPSWSPELKSLTGTSLEDLEEVVRAALEAMASTAASQQKSVIEKFTSERLDAVSKLPRPELALIFHSDPSSSSV